MSLEELRRLVDEVDGEILRLLRRRVELARSIAELKRRLNMPLVDPAREAAILARVEEWSRGHGLDVELALTAFKAVIGLCKRAQRGLEVAFLGPRGSFSEEAALKAFLSEGATFKPVSTIRGVFEVVERGAADYGVVPIENSLEGSVGETIDLLAETELKVCGEVEVRVSLSLIAGPGTRLEDVHTVLSHPHALGQCRSFLRAVLRGVKVRACSSTAEAVRRAVRSRGVAAIGSRLAAAMYGGEVLVEGVEDLKDNYTRFLVIGREGVERGVGRKTSLIFRLPNTPGSLHRALSPFAARGINLTCITSRPIRGRPWEYMFYVELEGGGDGRCEEALRELEGVALQVKVLGSYGRLG
ncbi:prephenate dehydratase [Candidatus Geothermarchaeota archaeon ex4572_27]|nr:MAG: prephenate dehydratase [Candidatus Geothermarchaeota archaeon ex4572_27]